MNSVESYWLKNMTDDEIRERCASVAPSIIARVFPGNAVEADTLEDALALTGGDFEVEKHPVYVISPNHARREIPDYMATVNMQNHQTLGVVGKDYGIVQNMDAFESLRILADRGDVQIRNVELLNGGSRVRITALLGTTEFISHTGAPNTLGHFAIFEATHDGTACTTVCVYTLRIECFNGMTSRQVVKSHKLRHTSNVADRVAYMTQEILRTLLGDVEAEKAFFLSLVNKPMGYQGFTDFSAELLGGVPESDASKARKTRFNNQVDELEAYFLGGNQGAGMTAWGAYNSVTRWVEAKRERMEDSAKAAKKFNANLLGSGQQVIQRASQMLQAA